MLLLHKLISEIYTIVETDKKLNIYALKGVGKEVWNGIDAQEYVDKERAVWE
ncbi:MAG: hypothetical protein HZA48_10100 [Planctomycetes bacterium]|nr:hypothetical protein [Planctomycetota bacterium]